MPKNFSGCDNAVSYGRNVHRDSLLSIPPVLSSHRKPSVLTVLRTAMGIVLGRAKVGSLEWMDSRHGVYNPYYMIKQSY